MNWQKFAIGGLIGGVVYFFLGWLVWGILLADMMAIDATAAAVMERSEDDMLMGYMVLSCLAMGAFISYIFIRWAGISTIKGGAIGGATIGFFISLICNTSIMSMQSHINEQYILGDLIASTVVTAIAGAAIGWYLGRD